MYLLVIRYRASRNTLFRTEDMRHLVITHITICMYLLVLRY